MAFYNVFPSFSVANGEIRKSAKNEEKIKNKKGYLVLLLNTGWHPKAGQLMGKM